MSPEDVWHFRHSGYFCLGAILPPTLLKRLSDATQDQIDQLQEPIVWEKDRQGHALDIRRLSKILDRDPAFMQAATCPQLLDALEAILGPDIELLTNKHNHLMVRPPGSAPVEWHSGEEPYQARLVTALIYLETSDLDNGCIRLVPGSHHRPFPMPRRPQESFNGSPLLPRSLPVPMPAGGILLFDDCCFHGADANDSTRSRRSMTLAYQAHDVHAVNKQNPEKTIVRGKRSYIGHPT
jgi:phytanoyl-CoA hydroxylase